MRQFSIAGWSQLYCRLEPAVWMAGADNRKERLFVPWKVLVCSVMSISLYHDGYKIVPDCWGVLINHRQIVLRKNGIVLGSLDIIL
jgi:hypothetical protein